MGKTKKYNPRPILAKRDAKIFSDFKKLFRKGIDIEEIYQKLSDKYFLSERSLGLIISKEAKKENV